MDLETWCRADLPRNMTEQLSRSGYLIMASAGTVSWCSKLKKGTKDSTSDAELAEIICSVREVRWTRSMLSDVCFPQIRPTTVYLDNLGAIIWTEKVQGLHRVKDFVITIRVVREAV